MWALAQGGARQFLEQFMKDSTKFATRRRCALARQGKFTTKWAIKCATKVRPFVRGCVWLSAALVVLCPSLVFAQPLTYAVNDVGQFGNLNIANGAYTPIGRLTAGGYWVGMGNLSDGTLVGEDNMGYLYRLDPLTGTVTRIAFSGSTYPLPFTTFASASGSLYGISYSDALYRIDSSTGAATLIGSTGLPSFSSPVGWANALAGNSTSLYYILEMSNVVASTLYRLDLSTGAATAIGPTGALSLAGAGLAGGTMYAYSGNVPTHTAHHIFSIDLTTGAATAGSTYLNSFQLAGSDGAVPEPGACLLCAIGVVALICYRRRSQSRAGVPPATCAEGA
jgi:hypothetical protein